MPTLRSPRALKRSPAARPKSSARTAPVARKVARPSATKTSGAKNILAKKGSVKKAAVKKPAIKKPAVKKPGTKRAAVKKAAVKKAAVKKTAVKKTATKRAATRKKARANRSASAKHAAKKTSVRRAGVKKPSASPKPLASGLRPLNPGERHFALDIPFELNLWASSAGVRWSPLHRMRFWSGAVLPEALHPYAVQPWSWGWHAQAAANEEPAVGPPVAERWQARPHQRIGAEAIAAAHRAGLPGFLLADDVGVGKTMAAVEWLLAQPWARRVLIVSPLSVLAHWRNTLRHTGDGGKSIVLLNYDQLGKLAELPEGASTRAKGKRKREASKGALPTFDVILWDEAHKGKNPESARSIMMRRLDKKAQFSVWMTATAGQDPTELAYLAQALSAITGQRIEATTLKAFADWCAAQGLGVKLGKYGNLLRQAKDDGVDPTLRAAALASLERVRDLLFEPHGRLPPMGIRRLPQDIEGWPDMERSLRAVELAPPERQQFDQAWETFRQDEHQDAPPARRTGDQKRSALVRQLRLRQHSSLARVGSTLDIIEEMLENGKRVAVSIAFHDTGDRLEEALRAKGIAVARYDGRLNSAAREAERLRFQTGQAPVILFTVEEGISLHQGEHEDVPRVLLVHDLRWSALQLVQIEGRTHRNGQLAPVLWLYAPDTIDEQIAQVLHGRVQALKTMMGDDTETLAAIEAVLYRQTR